MKITHNGVVMSVSLKNVHSLYWVLMFLIVDIDECAENVTFCHNRGECHNLDGSYNCTCEAGYDADSYCEEG